MPTAMERANLILSQVDSGKKQVVIEATWLERLICEQINEAVADERSRLLNAGTRTTGGEEEIRPESVWFYHRQEGESSQYGLSWSVWLRLISRKTASSVRIRIKAGMNEADAVTLAFVLNKLLS